jgi:hypothetical protein
LRAVFRSDTRRCKREKRPRPCSTRGRLRAKVYHDPPPDKKGPAPNRGAKENDMPFPKSRGRGGELRDPGPADLFKLSDSSALANSRYEKGPARRGRGLVGH